MSVTWQHNVYTADPRHRSDAEEVDQNALRAINDEYTRARIQDSALKDFSTQIGILIGDVQNSTVRSKIRSNQKSFDGIMNLAHLRQTLLGPSTGVALLGGFLYTVIHQSVRQAEQTTGRSLECYQRVIDKLRRCNDLGAVFYSRCTDSRAPGKDVTERLATAYSLLLAFTNAVIDCLDKGPLISSEDDRWKTIERREKECTQYLQDSEQFLFQQIEAANTANSDGLEDVVHARHPSVYVLPKQLARFYGRSRELQQIREHLKLHRSITIRGIAGVGKTSLALQYAHHSLSDYNVIIWMRSDGTIALDQSCTEALRRLGVIGYGQSQALENRQLWKDYLAEARFKWLVIFDNVDQRKHVKPFWPNEANGKIILTTQKPGVGFGWTVEEVHVQPFDDDEGRDCIKDLTAWGSNRQVVPELAGELNRELGGLPLGIVQMTALMRDRGQSIKSFLQGYRNDKSRYHNRKADGVTGIYHNDDSDSDESSDDDGKLTKSNPTLGANWRHSFQALTSDEQVLLGILSLLGPDMIPQDLFNHWDSKVKRSTAGLLSFCDSAEDFLDIEEKLMKLALTEKDPDTEMLSLHRLEQSQFEYFLDANARQSSFDRAAKLLHDVFPKEHVGQRFTGRWDECNRYIQHCIVLNKHYLKKDPKIAKYSAPPEFAKLVSWCSWYLWELADYVNFGLLQEGGMQACQEVTGDAFDQATWSLLNYNAGTVECSRGMFEKAKVSLLEALQARRSLGNQDDIAATLNNLGMLYNSTHEFDTAKVYYSEALRINQSRTDNTDRNLSLTMNRHNLQRNAIQSGHDFPTVEELQTTVDFFKTTQSWWMTGHSYLVLGNFLLVIKNHQDATRAFNDARSILSIQGRAGKQPATAMVIFKLGLVAFEEGKYTESAEHCRESIRISKLYPDIPAEEARTQFLLSEALRNGAQSVKTEEEREVKERVQQLLKQHFELTGNPGGTPCTTLADFTRLISAKYQ